ncbi:MAG: hypothetical protein O3B13_09125 [Planctomycetota bacterium]|nr:hypothetical protein [Planctomycetota bacterium]
MLKRTWVIHQQHRLRQRTRLCRRAQPQLTATGDTVEVLQTRILPAVTFQFDYSQDTSGFFSSPERRQILELAGNEVGSRLDDTLLEIIPHKFDVSDTWTATFEDPATGGTFDVNDLIVGESIIRVYVGARQLGSSLGSGGPGFASSVTGVQQWVDTVLGRGQAGALGPDLSQTDFAPFGGSIAFDEDANWDFGFTTVDLESGEFDFFSTAVHELAHVIGFGTANSFMNLSSGGLFLGTASILEYDGSGPVPLQDPGHWQKDLIDNGVEVSLDPDLQDGTRKLLTDLDYAGLKDLGWQVNGGMSYVPDILLASGSVNSLTISDDGISGNGLSQYVLNGAAPVTFATASADLLLVGGNNDDSIWILSIDSLFTGDIIVSAADGNDFLTVDPSIADAITYNGQLGNDSLAVQGGPANTVTHSFANSSDGSILVAAAANSMVYYAGLEPIFDSLVAVNRIFQFGAAADVITLDDDGTPGNGVMRLSSVSSSETVHFTNAIGTVIIDAGAGDDVVNVLAIDSGFTAAIEVRGGSGSDLINATAAARGLRLDGNTGNDTLQGGSGNDTLFGNADDDQLQGGGGNNVLDGGAGSDSIVESGDVNFVLSAANLSGVGNDIFVDIEQASLTGGASANFIDASLFTGTVTVVAGAGNDTVIGSANADQIFGGDGNDSLNGGLGNDLVNGEADDDQGFGGDGDDTLLGGSGDDTLDGEGGDDDIRGHAQNDVLTGGVGNDTIDGGAGIDLLSEYGNVNFVLTDVSLTGAGTDLLTGMETAELSGGVDANLIDASGFSGSSTLRGFAGADTLIGGSGGDVLIGYAGHDSLVGNGGDDTLLGSAGGDTLDGGDGNDRLQGQGGSRDYLLGGAGNDELDGGAGDDTLDGGIGQDTLSGDSGNDLLYGNDGDDSLLGGSGADTLSGDAGDDTLVGGDGNDVLFGLDGRDGIDGGAGDDIINGGGGNDFLLGGSGNDTMYGGSGSDVMLGMSGNDLVRGQGGFDILAGGSGSGADAGDVVDGDPGEIDEVFSITLPVWVESEL